jgi:hypothetical protein
METFVFAFSMLTATSNRVTDCALSKQQGPGMCVMWIVTSLLVWALVPDINFLFALAVGACVTPTDPVLSNSIVKGKFADTNIPRELQRIPSCFYLCI